MSTTVNRLSASCVLLVRYCRPATVDRLCLVERLSIDVTENVPADRFLV